MKLFQQQAPCIHHIQNKSRGLVECGYGVLVMATPKSDVLLHDVETLWALDLLLNPSNFARELKTAAGPRIAMKLTMEIHASYVKALWGHVVFPCIVLCKGEQNNAAVAIEKYKRSIAEYNPSSFFIVVEQFLDFLQHRVNIDNTT